MFAAFIIAKKTDIKSDFSTFQKLSKFRLHFSAVIRPMQNRLALNRTT